MFTTEQRRATLARVRRRRAHFMRFKPHWLTAIKDTSIIIDALESLVILDFKKGANDGKEKKDRKN
jgi:hypothetical protein